MHIHQVLFVLIGTSYLVHSEPENNVLFRKLGTYRDGHLEKTYWMPPHMRAFWYLTRPICKAHGFDIVTIKTLDEFDNLAALCEENKSLFVTWFVHIGAASRVGGSRTAWYWVTDNEKISYTPPFRSGVPDNYGGKQYCLSMARDHGFQFDDIDCHGSWEEMFICESVMVI